MSYNLFEKVCTVFFSIIFGAAAVAIFIMFGWVVYDAAPTSLYIIGQLVALWFACYIAVWWHDRKVKKGE